MIKTKAYLRKGLSTATISPFQNQCLKGLSDHLKLEKINFADIIQGYPWKWWQRLSLYIETEGTSRVGEGYTYTLLCLLDFELGALLIQVNWNEILKVIISVPIFIYYLLKKETICFIFVLRVYLLRPSRSSGHLVIPFLFLHRVHFHLLTCCTWNVLQHLSHDCAVMSVSRLWVSKWGCQARLYECCFCLLPFVCLCPSY